MTLHGQVRTWIADEVDPIAAKELQELLDDGDDTELADRFGTTLTFGTAGLRGPLRAGPSGMNRAVVRRAAAGVATWLTDHGRTGEVVVLGYDARHGSREFARDSAGVFAAAGFDARVLPGPLPTPVLAFAVQRLGAAAGVMVTASHNPPRDNGYKVYAADGAQIVPPADIEIEAAIRAVGRTCDIRLADAFTTLDDTVAADYVAEVAGLVDDGPRQLRIVHTALHGVGSTTMAAVFAASGFTDVLAVPEQQHPDPDFPTVSFPNPEEPGALDLALALAREHEADIVIANDPDADRCAVAVPSPDGWRMLRGDEVGVLLADALLRRGVRGTYATTIVSCSLLGAMARRSGVGYAETLTGFKWISRAADDLVFGYEEALGYAVAPDLVRDKDGISAALLVAELAAELERTGSSLLDRLDNLARVYGRYVTDQVSIRVSDLAEIGEIMRRVRSSPPAQLVGHDIDTEDLAPGTDAVRWRWATADGSGRVVIRPSGTEAKLKAYLEIVEPGGSAVLAEQAITALRHEVEAILAG